MKFFHILLALLVVFIWGLNFSVIKLGLEELPPILFSALRFALVAIPACFFIPRPKIPFIFIIMVGVLLGIIKFSLLFIGMNMGVSAGLASLILQIQVVFTIFITFFYLKEAINNFQLLGVCLSLIGFMYITFNGQENISLWGAILIILAGLAWSLSNVVTKKMPAVNMFHFMVWISLIPPIPLFLFSYIFESPQIMYTLSQVTSVGIMSLLFTSFFSTLIAFSIWGHLLRNYPAASITPFALLIPLFGMIISAATFDEIFTQGEIIAITLVMLGLILSVLGKQMYDKYRKMTISPNFIK